MTEEDWPQATELTALPVLDAPDRLFQVTRVSRTHTQVWLQSDRSRAHPYRLEVLFQWVQYLCTPVVLRGLSLRRATADERARISRQHDLVPDPRWDIYRLSRDSDAFIVSARPLWAESDLRFDDAPVYWTRPDNDGVVKAMGTIA